MKQSIRITVLVENTAGKHGLMAEHGIAFWIETESGFILFDTGQGLQNVLAGNAKNLHAPLDRTEAIVLSHGHYDHTGGLRCVLNVAEFPRIYAHPAAFQPKYIRDHDGAARFIGIHPQIAEEIRSRAKEVIFTPKPTEISHGIFVTGEIPRVTEYEDTGGAFFIDKALSELDPLTDDQALFFKSVHGTVIILGCAHAGVVNTLLYISSLTDNMPIHAVVGGMHLGSAPPQRIRRTIAAFRKLQVEKLGPCHCTGLEATIRLWSEFPARCIPCKVGTMLEFIV